MTGKLEFIQPGLYSSLQDQGRNIGRNWGIPEGGAMDRLSAKHANLIFNNPPDSPVLEITQMGPTLLCHSDGQLAVAGAKIPVFKTKEILENPSLIQFQKGDILKFGNTTEGIRSYISIKNGFKTNRLFDSTSPIAGISSTIRFKKGDFLYFESSSTISTTNARIKKPLLFQDTTIRTILGPEHHLLSVFQKEVLKNTTFTKKRLLKTYFLFTHFPRCSRGCTTHSRRTVNRPNAGCSDHGGISTDTRRY